jgi:signal transduction histidine kinase
LTDNRANAAASPDDAPDVRSGEHAFRPRARIIRTLGRELITNEVVAIQELVKNAYDADARKVTISFEEPLEPSSGAIEIADDGDGMTLEDLQRGWMEPATLSKVTRPDSRTGRRRTGEKGIGRFAAARVAGTLELSSVARENGRHVLARFDWSVFDDPTRYLDEVKCTWREEPARGAPSGTRLRLIGLHDDWTTGQARDFGRSFRQLRAQLSRLVSPLLRDDFVIELVTPERFAEFAGPITPPALLARPHYWLAGKVDAAGNVDAIYQRLGGDPESLVERKGDREEAPRVLFDNRPPSCGPFGFEFRVWDRRPEDLEPLAQAVGSTLRDVKRDLDAASGISIYRDNFRILLPEHTDWLGLDLRRVQNPTLRLSNNQIVGMVTIGREENRGLVDQSNRQGVVDSPAFDDFKRAIREVLAKLEVKRDLVRRPVLAEPRPGGLFGRIDLAPLRDFVAQRYGTDAELQRLVSATDQSITETVGEVKVVLARYRRLATLGQLIDGILHEGRTPIAAISNALSLARRDVELATKVEETASALAARVTPRLDVVGKQAEVLSELFRRLAPFSGRKRGRPRPTTMERLMADAVGLAQGRVKELGVAVELPIGDTQVTVDEAEMQTILFNLIDNALYWLERVPPEERRLRLEVERAAGELHMIVSDSGPGVDDAVREHIFDPYFSTRADGVGLGLALAGELALEYDGALELLEDGPLAGATFRVILRRRIGPENA